MAAKNIFVTGGNDGIGLALCKLLVTQKQCFVYMGSRSMERGKAAMDSLGLQANMELVQCDVTEPESVAAAASTVKASLEDKGAKVYGLVNNAGSGPMQGDMATIIKVTFDLWSGLHTVTLHDAGELRVSQAHRTGICSTTRP